MSSSAVVAQMNSVLEPFMFQVIGSTPAGLVKNIKEANLKGKSKAGVELATAVVFAAAVNKVTLENFLAKDAMLNARPMVSSALSIAGKTNMTAMTLLGHCILTTSFLDDVNFVKEFRFKMGQHDLWAGDFATGSLSEKQKKIYSEKKRVTNSDHAKLLGSGFFKYMAIDLRPMTNEEAAFWGETIGGTSTSGQRFTAKKEEQAPKSDTRPKPSPPQSPPRESQPIVRNSKHADKYLVSLSDGTSVLANKSAVDFYLNVEGNSDNSMVNSIERSGINSFNTRYTAFAEGGAAAAATTVGS